MVTLTALKLPETCYSRNTTHDIIKTIQLIEVFPFSQCRPFNTLTRNVVFILLFKAKILIIRLCICHKLSSKTHWNWNFR